MARRRIFNKLTMIVVFVTAVTIGPPELGAADAKLQKSTPMGMWTAITVAPARKQGAVKTGNYLWTCKGNRCFAFMGTKARGRGRCRALAKEVGPLIEFGKPQGKLSQHDLNACNEWAEKARNRARDRRKPFLITK